MVPRGQNHLNPDMVELSPAAAWKAHCDAHPVPPETLSHFTSSPVLSKYMKNRGYIPIPSYCRTLKPTGEDAYFAKTIATPSTIPHYLTLVRRGFGSRKLSPTEENGSSSSLLSSTSQRSDSNSEPDTITLITFGGGDLVGFPTIVHGGVSTALLDEPMSFVSFLYHVLVDGDGEKNSTLTANLNVDFRGPVTAPGQVVVECKLDRVLGRKYWVSGRIKGVDEKVLVEAKGLWIAQRAVKL